MMKRRWAALAAGLAGIAGAAGAGAITINLGPSIQNYVLIGQGDYFPGYGSFTNEQGSEVYDSANNTTTETLTGSISSASDGGIASGTYAFVTTFTGEPIGSGGTELQSESNFQNSNEFNYSYIDPSVDMTLYLYGTPTGNHTYAIVTDGNFDTPDFDFTFTDANCTGVAVCDQNGVGGTPGATIYSPTTIYVDLGSSAPEPAAWTMLLLGTAFAGAGLRARHRAIGA